MRFPIFSTLLSLAAIAAPFVGAQGTENNENAITKPAAGEVWVAGTPFPIEWTASANPGTVSIVLVKGVPGNLQVLETIAPNVANNGKFEWTPPLSLEGMQTMAADQVYQLKIVSDVSGNFGFSPSFKIDSPGSTFVPTGAPAAGATTTTSAEATSATSASAAEVTTSTTEVSSVSTIETSSEAATSTSVETSSVAVTSTSISETSATASTSEASTTSGTATTLSTLTRTSSASTSESTSSAETSSATETSDATETSAASETESSSPDSPPSSGLPVGVIAGITGGVIAFIILAIVGVFLFRRRKQQSRSKLRGETPPPEPSKYDRDFQMMERRARHRPTSSFGFNTSRSDTSGIEGRNDPYVPLDDRDSLRRGSETWGASRF